jgi:hypothetical protein
MKWGDTHMQLMAIERQVQQEQQQRRHRRRQQVQHKPGKYGAWEAPPS